MSRRSMLPVGGAQRAQQRRGSRSARMWSESPVPGDPRVWLSLSEGDDPSTARTPPAPAPPALDAHPDTGGVP